LVWAFNACLLPETKPESGASKGFNPRDLSRVVTERTGSAIVLLGFIQYYTLYNFLVFLPHLLSASYGLSASQKGMAFLPLSLFVVIGSYLGGRLQENRDNRKLLIITSSLNVLATLFFVALSSVSLPLVLASTALFGLFLGLSLPVQTTLLAAVFHRNRATAMGSYNFSRYLGMAAGPLIGALLFKLGSHAEFLFASVVFAGTVWFAWWQFDRERKEAMMRR
jgi:predicted MFS family arabinose efflux permease